MIEGASHESRTCRHLQHRHPVHAVHHRGLCAYVAVLLIYVFVSISGLKKTEKQIAVLEEAVAELKAE